jgi:uncharacterized protein YkwD
MIGAIRWEKDQAAAPGNLCNFFCAIWRRGWATLPLGAPPESMKRALLILAALCFLVAAHGRSLAAPPYAEPKSQDLQSSEQATSPNRPRPSAAIPRAAMPTIPGAAGPNAAAKDPHCPGAGTGALMCRLVNQYRAKHGLKPVRLDGAVTHESQYWSDQLNLRNACWFLYHDSDYHARMRARFPGRRFRENAACSGSTGGGAQFILQKWVDSPGHRQNMLTPEWTTIGVGVTKNIWVINFTN